MRVWTRAQLHFTFRLLGAGTNEAQRLQEVGKTMSSNFVGAFPCLALGPQNKCMRHRSIVCPTKMPENHVILCPSSGFRGKLVPNERFGRHLRPNFTGISFYGAPRPQHERV